jgi:hypothetical protein
MEAAEKRLIPQVAEKARLPGKLREIWRNGIY